MIDDKIQFRDSELKAKLQAEADSLGISLSDYARQELRKLTSSNALATKDPNSDEEALIDDLMKRKRVELMDEQIKLSKARRFDIADRVSRRNRKFRRTFDPRQYEEPIQYPPSSKPGPMLQGICITCGRQEIFDEQTLRSHKELGHNIT